MRQKCEWCSRFYEYGTSYFSRSGSLIKVCSQKCAKESIEEWGREDPRITEHKNKLRNEVAEERRKKREQTNEKNPLVGCAYIIAFIVITLVQCSSSG